MKHGSRLYDGQPTNSFLSSMEYEFINIGTFTVVVTGDRFLYKMVRNIVGTIVAAACGYLEINYIRDSIENQADSNDSM
jgi:tRNA U38,U39,U40 pseudouridine synthase TruA